MADEPTSTAQWSIKPPRIENVSGGSRVSCEVDGEDIWFESDDLELTSSIEAIAGTLLVPAMKANTQLVLPVKADPVWLSGQAAISEVFRDWWFPHYKKTPMVADTEPVETASASRHRKTAVCFTGGVDSFHALLENVSRIDALYFIHGFDIPLADKHRMAAYLVTMKEVARELNKSIVVLRTNLRDHHIFGQCDWRKTHGAAIAAGIHLIGGHMDRLIIPSSYHRLMDYPWGSHWKIDAFHSSQNVTVEHFGHSCFRHQKIMAVARNPLFLKHVRVCWENGEPTGNCSRCEKCLRTMVSLATVGTLEGATAFDSSDLAGKIDALPLFKPAGLVRPWSMLYVHLSSPRLRKAILHLIERSTESTALNLPPLHVTAGLHVRRWVNALRAGTGLTA